MYRTPYATRLDEGLDGATLGKTLGYLASYLAFAVLASPFALALRGWSVWIGLAMALGGTIFANRTAARGGHAYGWGVVVALGMGLMAGPLVLYTALTEPKVLITALVAVVAAVGLTAAMVAWIPWDFSKLAPLLFVGLLLLILTGLLSWIIPAWAGVSLSVTYNLVGVAIFVGYLLVDLSLLKYRGLTLPGDGAAVVLAVALLIDIVNLLLFLISLGQRRA